MKRALLIFLLLLGTFRLGAQHPVEPEEYPPGWTCSPAGIVSGGAVIDADHPCHCRPMRTDADCCGKPAPDPVCNQYCSEQHCACPILCHPGENPYIPPDSP